MVYANPRGFLKGRNAFSVTIHVRLCFYHKVFSKKRKGRKRDRETLAWMTRFFVWVWVLFSDLERHMKDPEHTVVISKRV